MSASICVAIMKGAWPVPSESPACLKLLTWLRMAGLEYEEHILTGPPKSATKKAPYIVREDGSLLDDSNVIIEILTAEHGIELDANRTARERALMVLVARTFESHLYFVGLLDRWRDHWPATRDAYFGSIPKPVRVMLGPFLRRQVMAQTHGQGLGRRPPDQVAAEARADLDAAAEILGDDDYFFGSPGVTDAIVYGALQNSRACPVSCPVQDAVVGSPRWMAYLDRIQTRYWADDVRALAPG